MSQEIAEYQIDGRVYTQTFLTIQQTIQLTKIIKGVKIDTSDIPAMLEMLVEQGKLQSLLDVVLHGEKPVPLEKIKPALLLRVIGDFFSCNEILDIISTVSDLIGVVNQSGVLPELTQKVTQAMNPTGTS